MGLNTNGDEQVTIKDINSGPHFISICKSESGFLLNIHLLSLQGFGFNVKGQVSEGGQLRFYCGSPSIFS